MNFLIIAIIGYTALAIVNILDKWMVNEKVTPLTFVFYAGIFSLPLFLILPWMRSVPTSVDMLVGLFSGFMFCAALLAMYLGFQKTEVSHSGPLVGASTALFVVLLGRILLGEVLSTQQLLAVGLIVIGCVLISFQKTKNSSGFSRALLFALLAGLFFAGSHISAKYMYNHYDFWTGAVWTKGTMGVCALFLLLFPSVRQGVFKNVKFRQKEHIQSSYATTEHPPRGGMSTSPILLVIMNRVLAILGTGLSQYATAIGSVSVVNALQGVQYAVLILLVLFLTRFYPKVFQEFYTTSEVITELIAVAVVAGGLVLLVVK